MSEKLSGTTIENVMKTAGSIVFVTRESEYVTVSAHTKKNIAHTGFATLSSPYLCSISLLAYSFKAIYMTAAASSEE